MAKSAPTRGTLAGAARVGRGPRHADVRVKFLPVFESDYAPGRFVTGTLHATACPARFETPLCCVHVHARGRFTLWTSSR